MNENLFYEALEAGNSVLEADRASLTFGEVEKALQACQLGLVWAYFEDRTAQLTILRALVRALAVLQEQTRCRLN